MAQPCPICREDILLLRRAVERSLRASIVRLGLKAAAVNVVMVGCSVYARFVPFEETVPKPEWLRRAQEGNRKCHDHLVQAYRGSRGLAAVAIALVGGMARWRSRATEAEVKRFAKAQNLYCRFIAFLQGQ